MVVQCSGCSIPDQIHTTPKEGAVSTPVAKHTKCTSTCVDLVITERWKDQQVDKKKPM